MNAAVRPASSAPRGTVGVGARRAPRRLALATLAAALAGAMLVAIGIGAVPIAPDDVVRILLHSAGLDVEVDSQQAAVLESIRLPRVLLAVLTGAGLGLAGALMQGLFRNPLADPALVGVSAGAALAASVVIVLGAGATAQLGSFALPTAAFAGALGATALVYRVGHGGGAISLPTMLLAGIAVNAFAFAGIGFLTYVADDQQLRDLTFWNLGSLAGGTWPVVATVVPFVLLAAGAAVLLAQPLNALALGEARAEHLGVHVARIKLGAIVVTALAAGAVVAVTGVIGFVGLVAPHLVRLACGPDQRVVIPGAALGGALLVVIADTVARTAATPADLPLGVLTAVFGAPLFLALLLRMRRRLLAEAA
ncbi:MAG: iron ABC transporter permease [Steroidobacteraceae bacterium]|jgi:iron complex transport system permease protein|nr:iron ABC transporter permease [Steroidobacteraceae bacterium]